TETSAHTNVGPIVHADQNNQPRNHRNNSGEARKTRRSPRIILNYSPIIDVDPALLNGVDIVVVNEIELRSLGERYGSAQLPTQERGGLANVAGSKVDEHVGAKLEDAPTVRDSASSMAKEDGADENGRFTTATRLVAVMSLGGLIVTLGPEGCFVVESEDSSESGDVNPTRDGDRSDRANPTDTVPTTNAVYVEGYPVDAVDSTGCGDCFMGTVAASIASGQSLLDSARLATFVASRAATKQGAQSSYSSAEELADQLKHDQANQQIRS
ncbi:MAG: PfkB family carbohydrate kinase, partial [Corynebacterium kroppenstedtii]|nr:PfkB family carbohydrate kinase [Corynebacterium kroppenstedtii]